MNDSSQLLVYPADATILLGLRSLGAVGFHRFERGREEAEAALSGLDYVRTGKRASLECCVALNPAPLPQLQVQTALCIFIKRGFPAGAQRERPEVPKPFICFRTR